MTTKPPTREDVEVCLADIVELSEIPLPEAQRSISEAIAKTIRAYIAELETIAERCWEHPEELTSLDDVAWVTFFERRLRESLQALDRAREERVGLRSGAGARRGMKIVDSKPNNWVCAGCGEHFRPGVAHRCNERLTLEKVRRRAEEIEKRQRWHPADLAAITGAIETGAKLIAMAVLQSATDDDDSWFQHTSDGAMREVTEILVKLKEQKS